MSETDSDYAPTPKHALGASSDADTSDIDSYAEALAFIAGAKKHDVKAGEIIQLYPDLRARRQAKSLRRST